MRRLRIFFKSGPGRGLIGQGFTLFSVMGVQLLQVPAYLHVLSAEEYGAYLVLIAIPSALTLADFGLLSALSTRLTGLVAAGRVQEASHLFRMGLFLVGTIAALALAGVITAVLALDVELAPFSSTESTSIIIQFTIYSLLFIASAALESAMRAANAYADAWIRLAIMRISDFICGVVVLYATGSVIFAVSGMLSSRILGLCILFITTKRRASWAHFLPMIPTSNGMAGMLRPTIGSAALPIGNAVLNQGVVLAVHASLGANAVAVYSTTKTIVNLIRQLSNVAANGILPSLTQRYATGREREAEQFLKKVVYIALALLVPCASFLAILGPWIIQLWTLGRLEPARTLVILITLQVLIESIWTLLAVRLLARNVHFGYSIFYAILSVLTVGALFLAMPNSIELFPLITAAQSAVMLAFVIYKITRRSKIE